MTDIAKRWRKEGARALCEMEVDHILEEYAAFRVAKRLPPAGDGLILLVTSPVIVGDHATPPVAPVMVLNESLYSLMEVAYGDIRTAARELSGGGAVDILRIVDRGCFGA